MLKTTISIIGSPKSGKNTLFRSFEKIIQNKISIKSKNIIEFMIMKNNNILLIKNSNNYISLMNLIDISDIFLIMIDGFFGMEYELFEFLFLSSKKKKKKLIFIITHLDLFVNWKQLRKIRKNIKNRIIMDTNIDSKFVFLSGIKTNGLYYEKEMLVIFKILEKNFSINNINSQKFYILINSIFISESKNIIKTYLLGNQLENKKLSNKAYISFIGHVDIISFNKKNIQKSNQKTEKNFYEKFSDSIIFMFSVLNSYKSNYKIDFLDTNISIYSKIDSSLIIESTNNFKINSNNITEDQNSNFIKIRKKKKNFLWKAILRISENCTLNYFDSDNHLILLSEFKDNKSCFNIVARIKKHKWCKKVIQSHNKYLLWISSYLFYSDVILCKQNSKNLNVIKKNLKSNTYLNLVLFGRNFEVGSLLIGIDNTINNNNSFFQNSFLILFSGYIIKLSKNLKIYNTYELYYKIIKTFKKTVIMKIKDKTTINISSLVGSIIYTKYKNKGIIKSQKSFNKYLIMRAIFFKNIREKDKIFSKIWIPFKSKTFYHDLIVNLPHDFNEMKL